MGLSQVLRSVWRNPWKVRDGCRAAPIVAVRWDRGAVQISAAFRQTVGVQHCAWNINGGAGLAGTVNWLCFVLLLPHMGRNILLACSLIG